MKYGKTFSALWKICTLLAPAPSLPIPRLPPRSGLIYRKDIGYKQNVTSGPDNLELAGRVLINGKDESCKPI